MASLLAAEIAARRAAIAAAAVLFIGLLLWLFVDPSVPFLAPSLSSSWISVNGPVSLATRVPRRTGALFRRRFQLERGKESTVVVRAFRAAEARLDGRTVFAQKDLKAWKRPIRAELGRLEPGRHELIVAVINENGPPVLRVDDADGALASGGAWESSPDGLAWSPVRLAERSELPELAERFPSAARALLGRLPALVLIFALAAAWALRGSPALSASEARWLLLGAWAALALNNLPRLPAGLGYDVGGHAAYVEFLLTRGRVPFADEGWQMFQPPLYYLLSAPLFRLLDGAEAALRVVPLLCGLLQVELGYRAARRVFPAREDLQIAATLFAACLPMSLYLSQGAGNEPLAGLLVSAAIVLAWREGSSRRDDGALGLILGLALLAKTSAVLIVPPLCVWVRRRGGARAVLRVLGVAAAVSGWYYARNWLRLGAPFLGGWDAARGIGWWQDPGYRSWRQLFAFGESLQRPVYAAFSGFWDSVYSTLWLDGCLSSKVHFGAQPPWNYEWMVAGAWLALIPTLCLAAGALRALAKDAAGRLRFSTASIAVYLAAMFALYAKVPAYSVGKATYALGLTPCLAVLFASGFDALAGKSGPRRAALWGAAACWAGAAYLAYFSVAGS